MAIILRRDIKPETKLGVWEIDEDADYLISRLHLNKKERSFINSITNEQRYIHWLASRVLLKELLETDEFVEVDVDEYGKPLMTNSSFLPSLLGVNTFGMAKSSQTSIFVALSFVHVKAP